MWTLYIDTTIQKEVFLVLTSEAKRFECRTTLQTSHDGVLTLLDTLLSSHNLTLMDLHSITVSQGPGSFTGLKVGVTVATVLSLLLSLPINGQKPGTISKITYGDDKWQL